MVDNLSSHHYHQTVAKVYRVCQLLSMFHPGFQFTSSLTSLLKQAPKRLAWNPSAEEAFTQLKGAFTTAPILRHSDTSKSFMVKVDGSVIEVGTILSQDLGNKFKLHQVTSRISPPPRGIMMWRFGSCWQLNWC